MATCRDVIYVTMVATVTFNGKLTKEAHYMCQLSCQLDELLQQEVDGWIRLTPPPPPQVFVSRFLLQGFLA